MDLSGWFSSTCYTAPCTGVLPTGGKTFGATVALPARVEKTTKLIRDKTGEEAVSSAQVGTMIVVGLEDRIWLPGEDHTDATIAHVPQKVEQATDKAGGSVYYQIFLA